MPKYWDYVGFSFNGVHSSDLGILRVSDGSRYEENSIPEFRSETAEVVGGHGTYFWGTNYTKRTFTLNLAYDSITEEQVRAIRQTYHAQALGELIFDEWPYKAYNATIESPPNFKFVPFKRDEYVKAYDLTTQTFNFNDDYYKKGTEWRYQLVPQLTDMTSLNRFKSQWYKGEGTITFVCYEPFAHSTVKYREDIFDIHLDTEAYNPNRGYYRAYKEPDATYTTVSTPTSHTISDGKTIYYYDSGIGQATPSSQRYVRGDPKPQFVNFAEWIETIPLAYIQHNSGDNRIPHTAIFQDTKTESGVTTTVGWRSQVYNPGDVATDFKIRFTRDDMMTIENGQYVNWLDDSNWNTNNGISSTIALCEMTQKQGIAPNDNVVERTGPTLYKNLFIKIARFTPAFEDKFIYLDTKSHLLYGAGANGEPTGNIYNKYIIGGDFFQIPVYTEWHQATEAIYDKNGQNTPIRLNSYLYLYSRIKYNRLRYNFLYY